MQGPTAKSSGIMLNLRPLLFEGSARPLYLQYLQQNPEQELFSDLGLSLRWEQWRSGTPVRLHGCKGTARDAHSALNNGVSCRCLGILVAIRLAFNFFFKARCVALVHSKDEHHK